MFDSPPMVRRTPYELHHPVRAGALVPGRRWVIEQQKGDIPGSGRRGTGLPQYEGREVTSPVLMDG